MGNNIQNLGNSLKHTRSITNLELNQNPIQALPLYFETFKKLRQLHLRGNQFTGQLPPALLYLDSLHDFKGSLPQLNSSQLVRFVHACHSNQISDEDRPLFFLALTGDNHALRSAPFSLIFQALNFPLADVQYTARTQLLRRTNPSLQDKPLGKGAHLSLLGKTFFDLKELNTRLEKLGIYFSKAVSEETTHLLLGHRPISFDPSLNRDLVFLNEKTLTRFLDRAENRYLAVKQEKQQLQSLKQLLLNPRATNIGLAVQLLKGGGVPHSLLTALLLAWKFASDRRIQKELRALLELNISEEARRALKYPISLSPNQTPERLATSIALLTDNTEFEKGMLERYFAML